MTDKEKDQIAVYREQGKSYTDISEIMNISINSIKTYCKRHGLGGKRGYIFAEDEDITTCEYCGVPVRQNPGRKKKRFCSNKCRNAWWNEHPELVNKKAHYEYECPYCKKSFRVYGNANRKYCCHECYVLDRFGGEANE